MKTRKLLLLTLLPVLGLLVLGATIRKFSYYAHIASLQSAHIIPLEVPGQNPPYSYATVGDVWTYGTNRLLTTALVFSGSNTFLLAYFDVLNIGTLVATNAYGNGAGVSNVVAAFVINALTNRVYATNMVNPGYGVFEVAATTTNTIDCTKRGYRYNVTAGNAAVTNFSNVPAFPIVATLSLVISNGAADAMAFFNTAANSRAIGSVTSNGIQIASTKILEADIRVCNEFTNWAAASQQ